MLTHHSVINTHTHTHIHTLVRIGFAQSQMHRGEERAREIERGGEKERKTESLRERRETVRDSETRQGAPAEEPGSWWVCLVKQSYVVHGPAQAEAPVHSMHAGGRESVWEAMVKRRRERQPARAHTDAWQAMFKTRHESYPIFARQRSVFRVRFS